MMTKREIFGVDAVNKARKIGFRTIRARAGETA